MANFTTYTQARDIAQYSPSGIAPDLQSTGTPGDFVVGPSASGIDIQLIGDGPALAQAINNAILSFVNEWYLNTADGMPWLQNILVKGATPAGLQTLFRNRIAGVDGVDSVTNVTCTLNRGSRSLTVAWAAMGGLPVVPLNGQAVVQL